GEITELDTFDVLPFSNFVSVVEGVSPERLKLIMEHAVAGIEDRSGQFAQIAGLEMVYDPAKPALEFGPTGDVMAPGSRIVELTLDDGTAIVKGGDVVEEAPEVTLATIDFLARGGDGYPLGDREFTSLGVSYQQALSRYIQDDLGGKIEAERYPEGGSGRITPVQ
ncbi:MAG: 5'-nucleotidase, partial [Geminicoccaceae bacterium]|nr:5'-nucleotidase [Geminicoccaceae bacterium]